MSASASFLRSWHRYVLFRNGRARDACRKMSGNEEGAGRDVGSSMRTQRRITRVANSQNHVITAAQLKTCGLSKAMINRRVRDGRLHPTHRGVYAVGRPDLSPAGVFHAAVLAVGQDSLLSHWATAAL